MPLVWEDLEPVGPSRIAHTWDAVLGPHGCGKTTLLRIVAGFYTTDANGTSFVRLSRYLRKVVPAVHRELNADRPASPDTADLPA